MNFIELLYEWEEIGNSRHDKVSFSVLKVYYSISIVLSYREISQSQNVSRFMYLNLLNDSELDYIKIQSGFIWSKFRLYETKDNLCNEHTFMAIWTYFDYKSQCCI